MHIRTKPTITIRPYLAGGNLVVDRPGSNIVDLTIDQAQYFNEALDDVMEVQSDLNMLSMWADDASEQMKIVIDTQVLLGILHGMSAANRGTAAGAITAGINLGVTGTPVQVVARAPTGAQVEIIDMILRLGQALDEQNIPETGRWVVMPTWAATYIKRSELRDAALTGDSASILRNGRLGMLDRFTLYSSNLTPFGTTAGLATGEYAIYAGHAHGLTFASQISKIETLRSELSFATLLRGLQVYGYKIIDGVALCEAIVTQ